MSTIVYKNTNGNPEELTSCPFTDENELELVLAAHPKLLQGEEKEEIHLIDRQISIQDVGEIDIFLVNSKGLPIITEVKLAKNQDIRRKIVGQIFDYVSALTLMDLFEIDELVDGKLQDIIGNISETTQAEDLWKDFTGFLRTAKTRFILAVDEAPESLLRIVQFLCRHTNLDIKLIQIQKFRKSTGECFYVPFVRMEKTTQELESDPGFAREVAVDQNYQAFFEAIKPRIPRIEPRKDTYRFAHVLLNNACEVRYDILARDKAIRISFKSWNRPATKVQQKVAETYPDWQGLISGMTLFIIKGQGEIISYATSIPIPLAEGLNSLSLREKTCVVMTEFLDRFGPIAEGLNE